MPHQPARTDRAAGRAATVQLAVTKGSRVIPLLLLAFVTVLFVSDHIKGVTGSAIGEVLASKSPTTDNLVFGLKAGIVEFFHAFSGSIRSVVAGTL